MKKTIDIISKCSDFLLISHVSPDGDTLGSAAALYLALKSIGKNVVLALDGNVPKKLEFLNGFCSFSSPKMLRKSRFECAIAIDTATVSRMGEVSDAYMSAEHRLNIDHHPTNERFGQENLIIEKASTGEIILELIEQMQIPVNRDIADSLYAAVSTDTNNFVYSNVKPETFAAAAKLAGYGARIAELCDMIYYRRSFGATKLISLGLSRMTMHCGGRISSLYMTLEDIEKCGAKREDCDVLVNYAREIAGVEIAIFVNEMESGGYKVSLRSNKYADVSAISVKYGGGGHKRASGHVMSGSIKDIINIIVKDAESALR